VFASTITGYPVIVSEQTGKHGARQDESLEEVPGAPYAGEDQDMSERGLLPEDRRGTPEGMTQADVEQRADIARVLGTHAFPGDRDSLLATAAENDAPDHVLSKLRSLPAGESFQNNQDVARALGLHVETHRF